MIGFVPFELRGKVFKFSWMRAAWVVLGVVFGNVDILQASLFVVELTEPESTHGALVYGFCCGCSCITFLACAARVVSWILLGCV